MKKLKSIVVGVNTVTATFTMIHDNSITSLEQDLILKKTPAGWMAKMEMEDFQPQESITKSAHKLAEWFERMANEIKAHEYDTLDLNNCDS